MSKRFSLKVLAVSLAALLSAPAAFATVITASNSSLVGQTLNGTTVETINLSSAIGTTLLGPALSGDLVLSFIENAPQTNSQTRVQTGSQQFCCGQEGVNVTVTNNFSTPQSKATVAIGSNSKSGAAPTETVLPLTANGTTNLPPVIQGGQQVFETDTNFVTADTFSGSFTIDLALTHDELLALETNRTLSFTITGLNSPAITGDSLSVDFGSPVPAPSTLALLGFGLVGVIGGRRRMKTAA